MLQETSQRLAGLDAAPPIIVCNEAHRFLVAEQLRAIAAPASALILEPAGRNTAPAIALAAIQAVQEDPDAILLVLPADHHIGNPGAFVAAVQHGLQGAEEGQLVTFGVVPSAPETGYGYIRGGKKLSSGIFELAEFVEKPDEIGRASCRERV